MVFTVSELIKLIHYIFQKSIILLYYRIEKQIVTEVGENMNDSEFPPLITNIPKLSILSVSI